MEEEDGGGYSPHPETTAQRQGQRGNVDGSVAGRAPRALSRTLDGLDNSLFKPGGISTRKYLNFDKIMSMPWGMGPSAGNPEIEERRETLENLDDQYHSLNFEVNLLRRARSSQQDKIDLHRRNFESRKLKEEMDYQEDKFGKEMY